MKEIIIATLLIVCGVAVANPTVEVDAWRPACEGSALEIVKDRGITQSIKASATHFAVLVEWTVHFVDGKPISAEYRESERKRFKQGEHAGELTGKTELKVLKTWKAENGQFRITDETRNKELEEIIKHSETKAEQGNAEYFSTRGGLKKL